MQARNMARCALFAALLALCAWISIPVGDTAFTMQTFGIALVLWLLEGKWGTLSIFVYLFLGIVGLPVFSGFQGGIGALLGSTGGYIMGFLVWSILYWLLTALGPKTEIFRLTAMLAGLLCCYFFGSFWFYRLYLRGGNAIGLGFVFLKCVVPYLIPDAAKLTAAWFLARRLKRFVY